MFDGRSSSYSCTIASTSVGVSFEIFVTMGLGYYPSPFLPQSLSIPEKHIKPDKRVGKRSHDTSITKILLVFQLSQWASQWRVFAASLQWAWRCQVEDVRQLIRVQFC